MKVSMVARFNATEAGEVVWDTLYRVMTMKAYQVLRFNTIDLVFKNLIIFKGFN